MYIIIAGAGTVGFHIASLLAKENHEVVVVEQSEEALENVSRQLDVKTISGNAAVPRFLKEAEANRADLLIAVTDSDETNIITCFIGKELGAKTTVARIRSRDYSQYFIGTATASSGIKKVIRPKSFGVDIFINPVVEAAQEIINILSGFYATPAENFADGQVQLREFRVENSELYDKPINKINFPKPCVIVTINRAEGMFTPTPSEAIRQGDRVYLITSHDAINEIGKLFAEPQQPARMVVVLGGGRVGSLVAEGLKERRVSVKIIEKSTSRCQEIAGKLDGITVVQGDGTDRDFLIEQGIILADAFVASTDSDELNILSGLLAKNLGVARNLLLVNNPNNISLAETVGVDVAASPPLLTARKIARFVLHSGVVAAAMLGGDQFQAIEFVTSPKSQLVGQKITEVNFPKGVIVGAIIRNNSVIIPPNDSVVEVNDHLVIVSPLTLIPLVEKLFK